MKSIIRGLVYVLLLVAGLFSAASQVHSLKSDSVLNYLAQLMPGNRIAVDGQGNAYLIAEAKQTVFPAVKGEKDILLAKINPAGTALVYNTLIGGSLTDAAADIAVDADGNVTLLVNSSSPDFPGAASIELGNILKSDDGAMNWQPSGRGILGNIGASEFVFDPVQPGVLFVSTFAGRAILYKSTNSGESWTNIGQTLESPVPLAIVPGAQGALFAGTKKGLMSSPDGGTTWSEAGLKQPFINQLVYDPHNPAVLYATESNVGGKIHKSTDGGRNWSELNNGLPPGFFPIKLAIDPANPSTLYAVMTGQSDPDFFGRLYRSIDGGASWALMAGFSDRNIYSLAVDPRNSALYVGTSRGMFRSADGGGTLQPSGLTEINIPSIAIDPSNPSIVYASTPVICCGGTPSSRLGGIHKSTDGGANWTRLENSLKDRIVDAIGIAPWRTTTLFAQSHMTSSGTVAYAVRLSASDGRVVFSIPVAIGEGRAMARDAADNLYLAGTGQLLTLRNALQSAPGPGFVVKLNSRKQEVEYASYLAARPNDVAVDRAGTIAIIGDSVGNQADSLVKNGFQTSPNGGQETFLCRIDPQLSGADSLLFGSYLGGQGNDASIAVASDANGMIYVAGRTQSPDFPTTPARQIARTGADFLAKVDPTKSGAASLLWATRLGAANVSSLAVDLAGNAIITGTVTGGLPVTPGALQYEFAGGSCPIFRCNCDLMMGFCPARCGYSSTPASCSDAFVTKIAANGSAVLYSTYLGSAAAQTSEGANDIALDQAGNVYLTGYGKLAATPGAIQLAGWYGFLAKLTLGTRNPNVATVSSASYVGPQLAPESLSVGFLDAFGEGADKLKASVRDSAGTERDATVLFSGFGQINFQIPPGTATGNASVNVTSGGGVIATGAVQIVQVAPGVFAANADGRGVAAAVIQRVKADGSQIYEPIARYDESLKRFVSIPIDLGVESDQVFLVIFGTGWRFHSSEAAVKVMAGGVDVPVTYAGLQPTLLGLDQINARLPRSLAGRGEIDLVLIADGKMANITGVNVK